MAVPNPVDQFDEVVSSSSFVFLLYYRGFWCPFCIAHLKELAALSSDIKAAGGTLLAVTADPPENLEKTRSSTGFSDTVIVDPENILAKELKNRGTLDVAISTNGAAWLRGYKHGMAQPALLVMKNDGTVLQRWAIVPSLMNLGGASDRPVLMEVWKNAQAQLEGRDVLQDTYSTTSALRFLQHKVMGT